MKRRARFADDEDADAGAAATTAAPAAAPAPSPPAGLSLRDRVLAALEAAELANPDGHGLKSEQILAKLPASAHVTAKALSAVLTPLIAELRVDMYTNPRQRFSASEETFFKLVPADRARKLKDLQDDDLRVLRRVETNGRMGEFEKTLKKRASILNQNKLKKILLKLERLKLVKKVYVHNQALWLKEGA